MQHFRQTKPNRSYIPGERKFPVSEHIAEFKVDFSTAPALRQVRPLSGNK